MSSNCSTSHVLLGQAAHPVPDVRLAVLADLARAGRRGAPGAATAPTRPSPLPPGGRTGQDLHDVGCGRCRHQGHGQRHLRADRALPANRGPPVGQQGRPGGGVPAAADASTRSFNYAFQFSHLQREAGRAAHKLLLGQLPHAWEVSSDLIGALHGVRLCGTVPVIAAAEALVAAASDLELNEKDGGRFQQQAEAVVAAQGTFLNACREDLSYAMKPWQLLRRHKESRFLRSQASR
ncbi:hypothetical protein [Streptomyces sp. NPDC055140]